jgi:hypothetical protein
MKKLLYLLIPVLFVISLSSFVLRSSTKFTSETESFEFFPVEVTELFKEGSCKKSDIQRLCKLMLENYIFESSAQKDYSEFKDKRVVEAAFSVYAGEDYRFIDASQGITEQYRIRIFDDRGVEIFSTVTKKANRVSFEFIPVNSGDYKLQYIFDQKETKVTKGKCVAFAIGYLN